MSRSASAGYGDGARFMRHALELAERGRGHTSPNPCVGAVLVQGGEVVAEGWHAQFGGPHAEVAAIAAAREAGVDPTQCELYVTLEPCNHEGKTPPCTKAILDAGIRTVVIGALDPNPFIAGGGGPYLLERGVRVVTGVLQQECEDAIADFVVWQTSTRPYVILKMAQTLDGKIAARPGMPEPVTGAVAKREVHGLRARVDAVLVGGETFRSDDPQLTVRLAESPQERQPRAVILTRSLPLPTDDYRLLTERPKDVIFLTDEDVAKSEVAAALRKRGVQVFGVPNDALSRLDVTHALERLRSELGVLTVLCEGGGRLAGALSQAGVVDELHLYVSPRVLGDDDAAQGFSGRHASTMKHTVDFRHTGCRQVGEDMLLTLRPALSPSEEDE